MTSPEPEPAALAVLSGSPAGALVPLGPLPLTVGRNTEVGLRFGPDSDLVVSGLHAVLLPSEGGWLLRDLDSTNGTFLNGRRIDGDVRVGRGDRITFGANGPVVEVRGGEAVAAPSGGAVSMAGAAGHPTAIESPGAARAEGHGIGRLARGGRGRAVAAVVAGAVLLLGGTAVAVYSYRAGNADWEGERALLQGRIDSLTVAGERTARSLEGEILELADALRRSQEEVREVATRLQRAQARGNASEVAALGRELDAATASLDRQEAVARLDFSAIQRNNRHAVAKIFVEGSDGQVVTGTAFAVLPDATLITSKHVLAGASGRQLPRRIAIQFSDSDQVWPARVIAYAADSDLAVVKVDNIVGEVPTVRAFNLRPDTVGVGGVVASIGFPAGREGAGSRGAAGYAEPLLSAGIITAVLPDRIEIQGYGAAGASGSPIFDAQGAVVGILFGGLRDSAHPTLLGVPAASAIALLESLR